VTRTAPDTGAGGDTRRSGSGGRPPSRPGWDLHLECGLQGRGFVRFSLVIIFSKRVHTNDAVPCAVRICTHNNSEINSEKSTRIRSQRD
jgi:hypothetical protein